MGTADRTNSTLSRFLKMTLKFRDYPGVKARVSAHHVFFPSDSDGAKLIKLFFSFTKGHGMHSSGLKVSL